MELRKVHTRMGLKNTDMHTQMTLSFKNTNEHQWARMIGVWGKWNYEKYIHEWN